MIIDSFSLTAGLILGASVASILALVLFIFHEWGHMRSMKNYFSTLEQQIEGVTKVAELSEEEAQKIVQFQGVLATKWYCPKCEQTYDSIDKSPSPIRYCPVHQIPLYPVSVEPAPPPLTEKELNEKIAKGYIGPDKPTSIPF